MQGKLIPFSTHGPLGCNEDMTGKLPPQFVPAAEAQQDSWDDGASVGLSGLPVHDFLPLPRARTSSACHRRIVLIRHGEPHIDLRPRTGHRDFRAYIDAYDKAHLNPQSAPPPELCTMLSRLEGVDRVFTSDRPRARESGARLLPQARLCEEALFGEAPLGAPPVPLLRMRVPKWAILSRGLWYLGFHPGIEGPGAARQRARRAAAELVAHADARGAAVLVGHGYFNFMIGRVLASAGYQRSGSHRARFWNVVVYEA